MLTKYPDGNVRIFFLLHTNKDGEPASTAEDAEYWDNFAIWSPHGQTLADGDKKGNAAYFAGMKSGNMILKRGFEVYKLNSDNFKADIAKALSEG